MFYAPHFLPSPSLIRTSFEKKINRTKQIERRCELKKGRCMYVNQCIHGWQRWTPKSISSSRVIFLTPFKSFLHPIYLKKNILVFFTSSLLPFFFLSYNLYGLSICKTNPYGPTQIAQSVWIIWIANPYDFRVISVSLYPTELIG